MKSWYDLGQIKMKTRSYWPCDIRPYIELTIASDSFLHTCSVSQYWVVLGKHLFLDVSTPGDPSRIYLI